jgi:hypothetical protein
MHVIPIPKHQVPSKSRRQVHAIVFELPANRKLASQNADTWEFVESPDPADVTIVGIAADTKCCFSVGHNHVH